MGADLFSVTDGAVNAVPFVVVELSGKPRGQGRPRSRIVFPKDKLKKPFVHVYTDPEDVAYQNALAWKAKAAMKARPLIRGPVALRCFAMLPIPKSWPARDRDAALAGTKFPCSVPDDDNYLKMRDAFNGVIWEDDAQVCKSIVLKEYCENPGIIFEIYLLP